MLAVPCAVENRAYGAVRCAVENRAYGAPGTLALLSVGALCKRAVVLLSVGALCKRACSLRGFKPRLRALWGPRAPALAVRFSIFRSIGPACL